MKNKLKSDTIFHFSQGKTKELVSLGKGVKKQAVSFIGHRNQNWHKVGEQHGNFYQNLKYTYPVVPLWQSSLSIWHCHHRDSGHCCGTGLSPAWGISTCVGCSPKVNK